MLSSSPVVFDHHAIDPRPAAIHRAESILVLSNHPSVTSLLCGFVSLSGHAATAPLDDEAIEPAILRVHPRIAIIDFEHPAASSTRVARQLGAVGACTVLYSTWQLNAEARQRAIATDAFFFSLPIMHKDFDLLLRTALLL